MATLAYANWHLEIRPGCGQCQRSRRQCEGYSVPKALVFDVCDDPAERRSYHFFREKAAIELSSYFGSPFWTGLVLQLASSQPVLQHAVAGIGALYESLNDIAAHGGRHLSDYAASQRQLALRQCNKSINLLRSSASADLNLETLLVASILFICQENIFGEWESVLFHLEAGLGLLRGFKSKDPGIPSTLSPELVEEYIAPVLARLAFQYSMRHPSSCRFEGFKFPPAENGIPEFIFPDQFNDLRQANACFENLNRHLYLQYACQTQGQEHDPLVHADLIPLSLRHLQRWAILLDSFIQKCKFTLGDEDWRAIAYLKMHHIQSRIVVQTTPYKEETVFDRYTTDFTALNEHAAEFVRLTAKADCCKSVPRVFTIEPHIVRTLHLVSIHCRHPSVRREAVQLLRNYNVQEGPWGGLMCAAVSERCRVIEERGLGEVKECSDLPESARIRLTGGVVSTNPHSPE